MDTYTATLEAQNEELRAKIAIAEPWVPHWIRYKLEGEECVSYAFVSAINLYATIKQHGLFEVSYDKDLQPHFKRHPKDDIPCFESLEKAKKHVEHIMACLVVAEERYLHEILC